MFATIRVVALALLAPFLAATGAARAASVLDLGQTTPPTVPQVVDRSNQPIYITNSSATAASGAVDSLRVGEKSRLHLGYGNVTVAEGDVRLGVAGDMNVAGSIHLGKAATPGSVNIPEAATKYNVALEVEGNLSLSGGELTAAAATADYTTSVTVQGAFTAEKGSAVRLAGSSDTSLATLSADTVSIAGSRMVLDPYSLLTTTNTAAPTTAGTDPFYALRVGYGGILVLNGGQPPLDPSEPWTFKGVNAGIGGDGLLVERGGVLRAGVNGGYIRGTTGQRLSVEEGGALDASKGGFTSYGFEQVYLGGSYLAGYNRVTGVVNHLDASSSEVYVAKTGRLGMSIDLQRALNNIPLRDSANATILKGGGIVFETGAAPVLNTGMGGYTLAQETNTTDATTSLWVDRVERAVLGTGEAADKSLFHSNMNGLWHPGTMSEAQANNIYNLSIAEVASIESSGAAGEMNCAVLESFVSGRNQPVADRGVADDGLYEMYNASPMYGLNTVAYNMAGEVIETVGRRLDRVNNELAGASGVASGNALAFFSIPEQRDNRFWLGGFGRREEADLDYGIAGYKYEPRGMALGYDKLCGPFAFGGAVTYGKGDYKDKAADVNNSEIAGYSGSLYGSYHSVGGVKASAFASYSWLDNDIDDVRGGMRRTADHHSHAWSLGAKVGYDLFPAERVVLSPSVGLTHIRAVNKAHDEQLDGLGVIRVGTVRRNSTLLPVDLGLGFDLYKGEATLLRLGTNLGYAYDFDDDGAAGDFSYYGFDGASAMPIAKRAPGRHRFNFGAGVFWSGSRLDFTAKYDYYRRADQEAHQVRGNIGVKF